MRGSLKSPLPEAPDGELDEELGGRATELANELDGNSIKSSPKSSLRRTSMLFLTTSTVIERTFKALSASKLDRRLCIV